MSDIYKRLESLRFSGETKRDFARRIGIRPQQYNKYREGRAPSVEVALRISRATGASPLWILTGRGPREGPAIYDPSDAEGPPVYASALPGPAPSGRSAPGTDREGPEVAGEVRRLGLKSDRPLTDEDRVYLAGSYLQEVSALSTYDAGQLSDLMRDLVRDPELRELIFEHWRFYQFRKNKP